MGHIQAWVLIYIYSLCMGAAITLANLHICKCLTDPSLFHTAISTKIKYAGLLDLFLKLNQAKLDML